MTMEQLDTSVGIDHLIRQTTDMVEMTLTPGLFFFFT